MRCFIAIDIDKGIRGRIGQLQKQLQKRSALPVGKVKWGDPDNIHLTLKFIGDVEDKNLTTLCSIVKEVAVKYESFTVDVNDLGYFGSPPRVVWVGVDHNPVLKELQAEINERVSEAGLVSADHKGFKGHLTICRVKDFKAGRELKVVVDEFEEVRLGFQNVDTVYVYSSELTKLGPIYTVVSSCDLK